MENGNQHENLDPFKLERFSYLERISLLTKTIDAPDNLVELFQILPNFQKVVELLIPATTGQDANILLRLLSQIEMLHHEKDVVHRLFPKSVKSKRKTLTDFYGPNPHYSLYWHAPETTDIEAGYRSMVASMLPVLIKLQRLQENSAADRTNLPKNVLEMFCRSLRQLSSPKGEEKNFLLSLPQSACPITKLTGEFEDVAQKYGIDLSNIGDVRTIAYVYRVLIWYEGQDWDYGSNRSHSKRRHQRSAIRRGARDTSEIYQRTEFRQQFGNENTHPVARYFPPQDKATRREEAFDAYQANEETPFELTLKIRPSKVAAYFLENRQRQAYQNAKFAFQAIEMANQQLPVTRSSLSGFEINRYVLSLEDLERPEWTNFPPASRPTIAAWAVCRFFLSRDESQIQTIKVERNEHSLEHPTWAASVGAFTLPTMPPRHKPPAMRVSTVPVERTFTLKIPARFARLIDRAPIKRSFIFSESQESEFKKLLKSINDLYQIDLTPHRVQRVVSDQMSQLAPADWVVSCYFEGRLPNQHNPAVYSVVPVERIQSLFDQSCRLVGNRANIDLIPPLTATLPGLVSSTDPHVGSFHVPQIELVKNSVIRLQKGISRHVMAPGVPMYEVHNNYTAYTAVFLLATTGIRAVSKLLPSFLDLDPLTGICFVSDKDNDRYGNAHLSWLCPNLVSQLVFYAEHTTRIRQYLALQNSDSLDRMDLAASRLSLSTHRAPNRVSDAEQMKDHAPFLFFLESRHSNLEPVSPSLLASTMGPDWHLRVGALRHFFRSQLLKANCSGEMINAQLGHGERGESAWGQYSTLPPLAWRKHLQEAIAPILDGIGFKALKSPLLNSGN